MFDVFNAVFSLNAHFDLVVGLRLKSGLAQQLVNCLVGGDPDIFSALHQTLLKATFKDLVALFCPQF